MLTELQGQIERITYTNEENGYTITRVKVYGRKEPAAISTDRQQALNRNVFVHIFPVNTDSSADETPLLPLPG